MLAQAPLPSCHASARPAAGTAPGGTCAPRPHHHHPLAPRRQATSAGAGWMTRTLTPTLSMRRACPSSTTRPRSPHSGPPAPASSLLGAPRRPHAMRRKPRACKPPGRGAVAMRGAQGRGSNSRSEPLRTAATAAAAAAQPPCRLWRGGRTRACNAHPAHSPHAGRPPQVGQVCRHQRAVADQARASVPVGPAGGAPARAGGRCRRQHGAARAHLPEAGADPLHQARRMARLHGHARLWRARMGMCAHGACMPPAWGRAHGAQQARCLGAMRQDPPWDGDIKCAPRTRSSCQHC